MSTIIPRNSWADAAKLHLAKFTDRPAVLNFLNTLCMVSRCSSQVVLVLVMAPTTVSSGGASAVFTILVKAAGRTVRPKPARLNSHNCPSASRKAVLCLSFSAIGNWWKPEARSI